MTLYLVAKYLHVVGAALMFLAVGFEWGMLAQLRRAQTSEQVREWARIGRWIRWLGPFSLGAVLVPGFYMAATTWREGAPWINLAVIALVLVAVLGALGGRGLNRAIAPALVANGPLPASTKARFHAPFLWISLQTRAGLLLAIVFLMTAKSDLFAALGAMAVAMLAAGAVSIAGIAASASRRPARQP
ncbi:MAG TPA: hypothetical protein VG496_09545 [Myxococcales bacterium]|nr:hypothetical protein [Myxococcales bacterium]